jgi:hypothetical protein
MPTINDRAIVDEIIDAGGHYQGDPQVRKIVQYTNSWGGTCYGLIYAQHSLDAYEPSEYVIKPFTLWEAR